MVVGIGEIVGADQRHDNADDLRLWIAAPIRS
jgi:hypothetical protein